MTDSAKDILRQSVVIAAAVFMLIGASLGGGAFGGVSVNQLQDGALSAEASYLAPAGPAFAIWTVIYLGLAAYTVWQALPAQRANVRQRRVGWLIAASMVVNGLWLVTARYATLVLTVVVIAVLLALLATIIVRLGASRATGTVERIVVDGTNGLHLGWVTIATVANTSAWLTATLPASAEQQATLWGVLILVVAGLIAGATAVATRRSSPAVATAWGIAWLGIGRLTGEPSSSAIGITAFIVAALLIGVALVVAFGNIRRATSDARPTA